MRKLTLLLVVLGFSLHSFAQTALVQAAPQVDMPGQVDSNSPAYWRAGQLYIFNSTGNGPVRSQGLNQTHLVNPTSIRMNRIHPWPVWFESAWVDTNGIIFAWYHQEHHDVCPGTQLAVPQIGAAISYDGGNSFQDLGAIISSGVPMDCHSQNFYFAGGEGDFSVILDRNQEFFYFLFTNYAGPTSHQGIAIARMPFASRYNPLGAVVKYYLGGWTEPGVSGHVTPIFPAKVNWARSNSDSFWGPSVHWNTYLNSFVMLLNHSCCAANFPQEGIYVSFSSDLSNPASWAPPVKILDAPGWYPQILGRSSDGTDSLAGRNPRLYVYGKSQWEIVFDRGQTP